MKNSGANSAYLLTQYKIEAPDLWWALDTDAPEAVWFGSPADDLEALHIVSPNEFDLVFEILDDDETQDAFYGVRNISKWRTLFTLTKQVKLSPESHAIIQKLKESPSLEKPGALAMLDAPIQEWENLYSYSWVIWLIAVRDLLWLTDYYGGQEWALEHISQASLEDLKQRTPK